MRAQYPRSEFADAREWSQRAVLDVLNQAEREVSWDVNREAYDAHTDVVERALEIWAHGAYVLAVVGVDRVTARRVGSLASQERKRNYNLVVWYTAGSLEEGTDPNDRLAQRTGAGHWGEYG
jgi:hypothetical protein